MYICVYNICVYIYIFMLLKTKTTSLAFFAFLLTCRREHFPCSCFLVMLSKLHVCQCRRWASLMCIVASICDTKEHTSSFVLNEICRPCRLPLPALPPLHVPEIILPLPLPLRVGVGTTTGSSDASSSSDSSSSWSSVFNEDRSSSSPVQLQMKTRWS